MKAENQNVKRNRRCLAAALSAVLLLCVLSVPTPAEDLFTDVSPDSWYAPAVDFCASHGLMSGIGEGRFDPNGTVTRAMAVTVLYRYAGNPATRQDPRGSFTDVPAGAWYSAAASWAAVAGIARGYGDESFGPGDPVTREQLLTFFWRFAGRPEPVTNAAPPSLSDRESISSYALTAVDWGRSVGVVSDMGDGSFRPGSGATRAQLAQILKNYAESVLTAAAVLSEMDVLCAPTGIALAEDGALLVTDTYYKKVWRVKDGVIEVYAGADTVKDPYGEPVGGYNDAARDRSYFLSPWAVAPFLDGWAVSDAANNALRLIRADGVETLNAGGASGTVKWSYPTGLAADSSGGLYVSDTHNGAVRRISPDGSVRTVAEGLSSPMGLCWRDGILYVAESGARRVLSLDASGKLTVLAGSGSSGFTDGPAAQAEFSSPQGLAVGTDGAVYIADTVNGAVRMLKNGEVSTLLTQADADISINCISPVGLLLAGGRLYVCDSFARRIFTIPLN